MSRAKHCLVAAALAVVSAASGGCADDYLSLLVVHNQAPDPEAMCAIEPMIENPYRPHGTANVAVGGYILTPLLQSNLTNRNDMVNGDIISLTTASVEINPVDSDASRNVVASLNELRGRTRYISGSVQPGGLTSSSFDAIDLDQARALAGAVTAGQSVEVLATVVVYGDSGGNTIKSATFNYPITIINDVGGSGPISVGACSGLQSGFVGASTDCFGNGQDQGFTQCCTAGTADDLLCPAQGTG
jgi:hypothetical protein